MYRGGRTAAQQRALATALTQTHRRRVEVRTLVTRTGDVDEDLSDVFLDGQIDMDASQEPTRTGSLTFADPDKTLPFDTTSASPTALYADRMIQVRDRLLIPGTTTWYSTPVFTGPISDLSRDGDSVTVNVAGKERLALTPAWHPKTFRKGMKKTDCIRAILAECSGESRFDIPDLSARLPRHMSLGRRTLPWTVAKRIAHGMGYQLFYDGAGICRMRKQPGVVVFSFHGDAHVTGRPQVAWDKAVVNAVHVTGGVPKGSKTHVWADAVAPVNHPLSPRALGRINAAGDLIPRYEAVFVQDDTIKMKSEAQTVADRRLHDAMLEGVRVSFDSLPVPFLDPLDLCHVTTDDLSVTFRLRQFTLPLNAGTSAEGLAMTVGALRNISVSHAKRRRHRRPAT